MYDYKDYFNNIDLSNNIITAFEGYTVLNNVTTLNLRHNNIKIIKNISEVFPNLENLILSFNKIEDFDNIIPLRNCKNLKRLFLDNNPICLKNDYFYKIINIIPFIKILDNTPVKIKDIKKSNTINDNNIIDIDSMTKENKLLFIIKNSKTIEDINKIELMISSNRITDEFLNNKISEIKRNN